MECQAGSDTSAACSASAEAGFAGNGAETAGAGSFCPHRSTPPSSIPLCPPSSSLLLCSSHLLNRLLSAALSPLPPSSSASSPPSAAAFERWQRLAEEAAVLAGSLRGKLNAELAAMEPITLILFTLLFVLILQWLVQGISRVWRRVADDGLTAAVASAVMSLLRSLPLVAPILEREQQKVVAKIRSSLPESRREWRQQLPVKGVGRGVLQQMRQMKEADKKWEGRVSGTVYMGGKDYEQHMSICNEAYSMFAHTNPLHMDLFPSVARFEGEVVAMMASLMSADEVKRRRGGGGAGKGGEEDEEVCGNMTSGGTESILMAVKSARDFMRSKRGITQPEMVVAVSAHSAYDKAANYFGIRLRRAAVGADLRADVSSMRRLITRNTVMLVASAPGFPHGVIDPIEALSSLALSHGICLHVDCCLGGLVLPFAKKLGYPIPPFDFSLPGVTSMSVDVHKYGLTPKGCSVVLYSSHTLRRHQFVAVTEWSGGLYVSPSIAGSRPGGLIAGAWAAIMAVGEDGYLRATREVMEAAKAIQKGIDAIDGLRVLGDPDMTIVAFASDAFDIYAVNDAMAAAGWSLNALQFPPSVHVCVTLQMVNSVDDFIRDLQAAVEQVRCDPSKFAHGMAPIYGGASKMPDRGTVKDLLVAFMDCSC